MLVLKCQFCCAKRAQNYNYYDYFAGTRQVRNPAYPKPFSPFPLSFSPRGFFLPGLHSGLSRVAPERPMVSLASHRCAARIMPEIFLSLANWTLQACASRLACSTACFSTEMPDALPPSAAPTRRTRMYVCTYIHTYMHTYIHTYIYAYIHTYIHTCIHTHVRYNGGYGYAAQRPRPLSKTMTTPSQLRRASSLNAAMSLWSLP